MKNSLRSLVGLPHLAILALCIVVSQHSYLFFHVIAEVFSIVIATHVFIVAWGTVGFAKNRLLAYIGTGYLAVGFLDLLHMISYKGMGIIDLGIPYPAVQFWIAARGLHALIFLFLPIQALSNSNPRILATAFGSITALLTGLIWMGVFPAFFIDGSGLTKSKVYLEYLIIISLLLSIYLIRKNKNITPDMVDNFTVSLVLCVCSEFAFTLYEDQYDTANKIGHLLKISAYYVVFRGVVQAGFQVPLNRLLEEFRKRRSAEEDAGKQRDQLRQVLAATKLAIWEWDLETGKIHHDEQWNRLIGAPARPIEQDMTEWLKLVHPEDQARIEDLITQCRLGRSESYAAEIRLRNWKGEWIWVQTSGKATEHFPDGTTAKMSGLHSDITERVLQSRQLELSAKVFDVAREGILIADRDATIISANQAVATITGYPLNEVIGRNPRMFSSGLQDQKFYHQMWSSLLSTDYWEGEVWNRHKNGQFYAELLKIVAIRDERGALANFISLFSDITRQKNHQKELERIAYFDALTELPNRVLLADRLRQAILKARRQKGISACLYLDLDGFKAINDNHGHETGDRLLKVLADRLRQLMRKDDTLARMGGDEFVGVVVDLPDLSALESLLERILQVAAEPVRIDRTVASVSISIGISVFSSDHEHDADLLLRQADQALYQSKLRGKNCFTFFDQESDQLARGRFDKIREIRSALRNGEFCLFYQPKVDIAARRVIGAEALIRWNSPGGLLPPSAFLPYVQGQAIAIELGNWVIGTALQQIEAWRNEGLELRVSVNVDLRHLDQPDFPDRLAPLLSRHLGPAANLLELEILETSGMEDEGAVIQNIERCRQLGVSFALDDFGTGYSSLSYLRRLPVNEIKIDQSFVRDMLENPGDLAIVEGIVKLAEALKREVIAEGVETPEIQTALMDIGCFRFQGYHISRPMPADQFPEWLKAWEENGV